MLYNVILILDEEGTCLWVNFRGLWDLVGSQEIRVNFCEAAIPGEELGSGELSVGESPGRRLPSVYTPPL